MRMISDSFDRQGRFVKNLFNFSCERSQVDGRRLETPVTQ